MLSFGRMKSYALKELNVLASSILWIIGAAMVLLPSRLTLNQNIPFEVLFILGIICFESALSMQRRFTKNAFTQRGWMRLFFSEFALLSVGAAFLFKQLWISALIVLTVSALQLAFTSNRFQRLAELDLLALITPVFGLLSGVYLSLGGDSYQGIDLSGYRLPLILLFFGASLLGLIALHFPNHKHALAFFRIQALPWLAWCFLFLINASTEQTFVPFVLAIVIWFAKITPWHRLTLPDHDVLGRRMTLVTSVLGLATLIFLGALLTVIDHALASKLDNFIRAREATFMVFMLIMLVLYYQAITVVMMINGLLIELTRVEEDEEDADAHEAEAVTQTWNRRLTRYLKPFILSQETVKTKLLSQNDQLGLFSRQLENEKKRSKQLLFLNELSQQLENQLDPPVSAQLAVNTLEQALALPLISLYVYEADTKDFILLAAAGPSASNLPAGYRQNVSIGAIGRAARQRKTQIINDVRLDSDYIYYENEANLACAIVPIISNGYVHGVIVLNDEKPNSFSSHAIHLAESIAGELTRAWERSGYHQRLMELIRSGSQLSAMVEPESTANEIAAIAKDILQARFTFIHIQLGQEEGFVQTASAGQAPKLLEALKAPQASDSLIQAAFRAVAPFRVRDLRKYAHNSSLELDQNTLRSMLAIPIRWHRLSIGVLLAFGKQNEVFFTENDEALAELLSIQAAGAFESAWLQQELRASLRTTSLLYRLSTHIIQAENLQAAAKEIALTAHKLSKAERTGIALLSPKNEIEAEWEITRQGETEEAAHPFDLIEQALETGQLIYMPGENSIMRLCLPIQTPISKYGALWINIPEDYQHRQTNPADLQTLVNQAAIALERSLLLVESQRQAAEIQAAYNTLETTYDQTLAALTSALDARDRETEGHSVRVSKMAAKLGQALNFSHEQLKVLERGSLLHDIGKIGVSDSILHKPGPLNEDEWKLMRLHPEIGAKIVQGIPFLEDTIQLVRHHQERWDGSGYPAGQAGEEIPILARMFSVVDAFDALTSNRPYRQKVSTEEALQYLRKQANVLFDPQIVDAFEKLAQAEPEFFKNLE
ncbi:MAG: GAF domain-containing protein [Anaerolineales bacterium]|nr:GAF domain-containing protein [Anaerolineales bacterium]